MRVVFVSSAIPRKCGIATFSADIMDAVKSADPDIKVSILAIDEQGAARAYGPQVKARIKQKQPESYLAAAQVINAGSFDLVNIQHEFGLYGIWQEGVYQDHLCPFLEVLRKPALTTLHSVPPNPSPSMRKAVQCISKYSAQVIVMAHTAARLLASDYGIDKVPLVIPHGMPAVEPTGRKAFKRQFGVEGRTLLSTFGLVDPRKGLEYVINAMPNIVSKYPQALYLIVGQTHPELLKEKGEEYRNSLSARVDELGISGHVAFVNEYLTQRQIVDYLLATDVYVTPYLDPNQITSGTLAYALGAGKAIVSTPYLHAVEALAEGRGILVPFADAQAIADAVTQILEDSALKSSLEQKAYAYGRLTAWPEVGRQVVDVMRSIQAQSVRQGSLQDSQAEVTVDTADAGVASVDAIGADAVLGTDAEPSA